MKKILLIAFMLVSFIGYSQIISDTTINVSTVYYELSWDSSYKVECVNGEILVSFEYFMTKYVDGVQTKYERHREIKNITNSAALVKIVLSDALVEKMTTLLNNRKKQLVQ